MTVEQARDEYEKALKYERDAVDVLQAARDVLRSCCKRRADAFDALWNANARERAARKENRMNITYVHRVGAHV